MTVARTVGAAIAASGLEAVDAHVLLAHATGRNRAWMAAHADDPLDPALLDAFLALAARRRAGEPVAYLVGRREFWGLSLVVSAAVLVPRPETELLVEWVLSVVPKTAPARILDLGTGSGAVALAIATERPQARVVATDISPEALAVARANAARLAVANVEFVAADWWSGLDPAHPGPWDAIVSNPPYIREADPHLERGDLRFEPAIALSPGPQGLEALRTIVAGAVTRLRPGGLLAVEHGYDQGEEVRQLMRAAGFVAVETRRDLAGRERVTVGR